MKELTLFLFFFFNAVVFYTNILAVRFNLTESYNVNPN